MASEALRTVPDVVIRTAKDLGGSARGFANDVLESTADVALAGMSACMHDLGGCFENIQKAGVAGAVGFLATDACEIATLGAGGPACVAVGFAVGGAVHSALSCPRGKSVASCAAEGGIRGAAAGVGFMTCGFFCAGAAGDAAAQAQSGRPFNAGNAFGAGLLSFTGATAAEVGLGAATRTRAAPRAPSGSAISDDAASSIVRYDPELASRQLAGQNLPGSTGYATTPGGRTLSAHAAERTFLGGPGRAPVDPALVDDILTQGTKVGFDPIRDTIKVSAPDLCGRCYVVVDAQTGQHVVTVMVPK
ncbi:MAG TPA: hypothetical protein VGJ86_13385 [Acidimicrobiales bacterium]